MSKNAAEEALDAIAEICGCPHWEYPGQVVRDVKSLRALTEKQDQTIRENLRALAVGCRFREGLEGARKALESNQPHAAIALIETAILYKP